MTANGNVVPEAPKELGVVPEEQSRAGTRGRRDSFRALSAPVAHHGDHQKSTDRSHHGSPPLPVCLVLYIAILAVFCGFLVSGCHKAYVYSGCLLGINGCNSLNGYKYEKMGYILIKALPEVPEELIYITCAVIGATICGIILAVLPEHLHRQVISGGTTQSLVAVATGEYIPLQVAVLRLTLSILFLMSGGSMGAEGPSIQVCTSFAMLAGWYSGIRASVTQSLLASLGFSCGFAASFNAPLAGITFAMEELQHVSTRLTPATIYMIMLASAVSTSVARATAGNGQLFNPSWTKEITDGIVGGNIDKIFGQKMWMLISVPIAIACALCGYVISRSSCILHDLRMKYRPLTPTPLVFAIQALISASLGAIVFNVTGLRGVWGIGAESLEKAMQMDIPMGHFVLFAIGKAVALVLAMSMRCPADILEPVLVIGGFIGGALGCLLPKESLLGGESPVMPCVIFGMVALFASCFRFSLTPIVIVLEIVGTESYSLILPAVLCGFTAATCSDYLFPALLEDILVQDGIDLEELAAKAEEGFEAEEAAREQGFVEESEEEEVPANHRHSRSSGRHGTVKSVKSAKSAKSRHSVESKGSGSDEDAQDPKEPRDVRGADRHWSRSGSMASQSALHILRHGLEDSLMRQSRTPTLRVDIGPPVVHSSSGVNFRRGSTRGSLASASEERERRGSGASKGALAPGRRASHRKEVSFQSDLGQLGFEVPLEDLQGCVDLHVAVREVTDDHTHKKTLLLQVAPASESPHGRTQHDEPSGRPKAHTVHDPGSHAPPTGPIITVSASDALRQREASASDARTVGTRSLISMEAPPVPGSFTEDAEVQEEAALPGQGPN